MEATFSDTAPTEPATIEATFNEINPGITAERETQDSGANIQGGSANQEEGFTAEATFESGTLSVNQQVPEAEVNFNQPELSIPDSTFNPNECVPINLNDCRTMSLLLGDTEKYKISPEYAEILKATYDKNCGEGSSTITEDDCGENASVDPTTGECSCDDGYIQTGEEEYTVDFAATSVTYTRPICEDCDDLNDRIEVLKNRQAGANNDAAKAQLQTEIDRLEDLADELGCNPPPRTCEDVQADLDALNNSPTPPTADEIAALNAEAEELGCEEPDDCGENQIRDANGDCMCDEENGYFDITNPNSTTVEGVRIVNSRRICVNCEELAERIKTMEDSMANLTDAQKAQLQTEIDRLEDIQEEQGCTPPPRTCEDVQAELDALDNNPLPPNDPNEVAQRTALEAELARLGCTPRTSEDCEDILAEIATLEAAPQLPPEESQRLTELKQLAERNQCEEPDPCRERLEEIESLMDQGQFQEAYQKQIEFLESDCRGIEGCRAKLARALVAKAFLEFVQNDPILTAYFQAEYEKHVDDYFNDPTCDDRSCDELEGRLPSDGGTLNREPVEIVEETERETGTNDQARAIREQAEQATLSLANDTSNQQTLTLLDDNNTGGLAINNNLSTNDNNIIRINNTNESANLTINTGTREINLLSQSNLERQTIDATLDGSDLLTDDEYYERYCEDKPTLTVVKQVINDDGGSLAASDFTLYIDQTVVTSGTANELAAGSYVVSEDAVTGYNGTITGDCDANGNVTLAAGENKTCTIINNDVGEPGEISTTLTVVKQVVNDDGGTLDVNDFNLYIDQTAVTSGATNEVTPGSHVVSEDAVAGYSGTISGDCDANGNVTLAAGENKTCAIVNNDNTPGEIPEDPEFPPASPSDDPIIISETVITPPTTTTTTTTQPELHGGAPEVQITESPEITKTGPEMYFFFFVLVSSQVFYFRKKIYAVIQNR